MPLIDCCVVTLSLYIYCSIPQNWACMNTWIDNWILWSWTLLIVWLHRFYCYVNCSLAKNCSLDILSKPREHISSMKKLQDSIRMKENGTVYIFLLHTHFIMLCSALFTCLDIHVVSTEWLVLMHASALLIMMPQLTTALYEPDRALVPILGQVSTAERK